MACFGCGLQEQCRIVLILQEEKMKTLFHKWLLLFIVLAFGLSFGLSWYMHRKEAKENALRLITINLKDVAGRIKRADNNVRIITELSAASAIAKTRAFSLLIQKDPAILKNFEDMELIRKKLDVEELHVSDKTGKLIASLGDNRSHGKNSYLGFNLAEKISPEFLCGQSQIRHLSWFRNRNTAVQTAYYFNIPVLPVWMNLESFRSVTRLNASKKYASLLT
jgi:hypothetical protein